MTAKVLTAKTFDLVALVKPRIMIMALLTAAGAMSLAPGVMHPGQYHYPSHEGALRWAVPCLPHLVAALT